MNIKRTKTIYPTNHIYERTKGPTSSALEYGMMDLPSYL
ncbi:BnaA09g55180D [Brassica napus]|uniref:BnaA09g55180D protein n=1 Tax=Brassica napus TaxID=3708 RepID=A0A078IIP7_BRANA|nr:BnaA09g55180D [Brassica napus]